MVDHFSVEVDEMNLITLEVFSLEVKRPGTCVANSMVCRDQSRDFEELRSFSSGFPSGGATGQVASGRSRKTVLNNSATTSLA